MQRKAKLYALLVGINTYERIRWLNGCEADVARVRTYLEQNVSGQFDLSILELPPGQTTKDALVEAFETHLIGAETQPGDVLLFYYSGHGTQEAAPEVFWASEPNHKMQVFACSDADIKNSKHFLADKELRYLLARAAKPGVELVVITDSCHSGDATRAIPDGAYQERLCGVVGERAWSDFIFGKTLQPSDFVGKSVDEVLPESPHYHLAACKSHESAWEEGSIGGIFTTALLKTLDVSKGNLSYYELNNRIGNHVKQKFDQSPHAYFAATAPQATGPARREDVENALFKTFLGSALRDKPLKATVYFSRPLQAWVLDKGGVYGVTKIWEGSPQTVMVNIDANTLIPATIQTVYAGFSIVSFEPYADILLSETYDAVVPSLAKRILPIWLRGDEAGVTAFKTNFSDKTLEDDGLRLVEQAAAEYGVLAHDGAYHITRRGSDEPVTAPIQRYNGLELMGSLEKIGKYAFVKHLQNPEPSALPGAVELEFYQAGQQLLPKEGKLTFSLPELDKEGRPTDAFRVKVVNRGQQPLYCAVLHLADRFAITPIDFEGGDMALEGGRETFLLTGKKKRDIYFWIDRYAQELRWPAQTVHLLLIFAPSPFEVDLFQQKGMNPPLEDQLKRGSFDLDPALPSDWQTTLYEIDLKDATHP